MAINPETVVSEYVWKYTDIVNLDKDAVIHIEIFCFQCVSGFCLCTYSVLI